MSPGGFRPAGDAALRLRQPPPFGGHHTTTSAPTSTATATATAAEEEQVTETPAADSNPYYAAYSKYASDYSKYADYTDYTDNHHATSALPATMTATMTVTGANAGTTPTSTSVYDHGSDNDHSSSGIGSSAIAGIAVGSVLGVSILGALLVWFCVRGRQSPKEGDDSPDQEHGQERSSGQNGPMAPAGPMVGPVGPSVHAIPQSAAGAAPRLPSPFRQRHQTNNMMHMQTGSDEEMVAFAKATNTAPARSIDEDPPAYEETEGHRRAAAQPGYAPLLISPLSPEYAAGTVSDGFRRYHEQPVDTESKPYDHLGRV